MTFYIKGIELDIETENKQFGNILGDLDELVDKMGAIISAIHLDGKEMSLKEIEGLMNSSAESPGKVDVSIKFIKEIKVDGINCIVTMMDAAISAFTSNNKFQIDDLNDFWLSVKETYYNYCSVEEQSFLEAFEEALEKKDTGIVSFSKQIKSFFVERLVELENPELAMLGAAKLFFRIKNDLSEVSLKLQTGRDKEAINTMIIVVELISKTVRVLPDYLQSLHDKNKPEPIINGCTTAEFYGLLNNVLKELADAFEAKDGILIGDLAEYEISPRLEAFFSTLDSSACGEDYVP